MGKSADVVITMFQAYQKVDDAKRNLDAAYENLAQIYANLPWTMFKIIQEINSNLVSGQFDRTTSHWLIQRVQEIRSPFIIS
jgi:hypothetical protein